jgi:hypothetical protein
MFHNYGLGAKHTSKRDAPTARNARRLAEKAKNKNKWKPAYGWEGEIICEKREVEKKPELTYDEIKKILQYFEKYGVNL